jgi:membrane fusion protein, multidrug efflux system
MKFMRRKVVGIVAAIAVISVGGAFAYHNLQSKEWLGPVSHSKPETAPGEKLNPNGSELVVRAYLIEADSQARRAMHTFTGTLQPRYLASVGFRVSGKISERTVELGQHVRKGQVLFRLDPDDSELQLRVAEADQVSAMSMLKQATAEEARLIQLRASGSVSQSDYDLALSSRDVAIARVDGAARRLTLAKNQRTYFDLIADSDGLVTSIQAEAGQVVAVGQPVLQIMQNDELEVVVSLPEGLVGEVRNLSAIATLWSRSELKLRAELRELSPIADSASRTYDAKFRLLDQAKDLAIGMTASIQLSDPKESGITVPLTSISSRNDQPIVWRIEPHTGKVEAISVEVIEYRSDTAIIRGELQQGDRIVSAGVQRIDENVKVRVWETRL